MSWCIQHFRQGQGHLRFRVCCRTLAIMSLSQQRDLGTYSIPQSILHQQEHIQQPCR